MKIIYLLFAVLFFSNMLSGQTRVVSGSIRDQKTGAGIPSATVKVAGQNYQAVANAEGIFKLTAPDGAFNLEVSSAGFVSKNLPVSATETNLAILLSTGVGELGEVVVTALGITKEKRSLTYALQKVNGNAINEAKEINIANELQGRVAGLTVTRNGAGPGSSAKILLRGSRSISNNNQPLYVVDGVPLDNSTSGQAYNTFGGQDAGDGVGMINADDIESVNVLKGASAAALYGSAGQNGAIIFTTKRGRMGRMSIDYNGGYMWETAAVTPDLQFEYGQGEAGVYNASSQHSWGPKATGQNVTLWNGDVVPMVGQTDRMKDFFKTAKSLTNTLSVSGGDEKMQTFFSYGNTTATGIIEGNTLNRHNILLKFNNNITSKLSIETKLNYIYEGIDGKPWLGEGSAMNSFYRAPVSIPLSEIRKSEYVDELGNLNQSYWRPQSPAEQNPYWITKRHLYDIQKDRLIGLLTARYDFSSHFNFQIRGSFDKTWEANESKTYQDSYNAGLGSTFTQTKFNHYITNIDALASFAFDISTDFHFAGNAGASKQDGHDNSLSVNSNGLNKPDFFSMANAKSPLTSNYESDDPEIQSVYASATFDFRKYLYLTITGRNDWSSALPAENRSYFYPSVGLTGIISDMVKLPAWISYGKVRISYAEAGAGGNAYLDRIYYTVGAGGLINTPTIQSFGDYKPEETKSFETGLNWEFLNGRLGIDATYYHTNTENQLLLIGAPAASLYDQKYINAGLITNQGIEIVLQGTPVSTRNFSWNIMANFSRNVNNIVRLTPEIKSAIIVSDRAAVIEAVEGGSYGDIYVKGWVRDSLGRKQVDENGKPLITSGFDHKAGNYNPDFGLGVSNTFTYKGFSLSFLIDWRKGGYVIAGTQALLDADGHSKQSLEGRETGIVVDGYFADGKKNDLSISAQDYWSLVGERYPMGELYTYTATNVRMREMVLSYRLPTKLIAKTKVLTDAKLSFVGRNLFFFYRKAPFDPEIALNNGNGGGIEYSSMPSTRALGVNLKLSF